MRFFDNKYVKYMKALLPVFGFLILDVAVGNIVARFTGNPVLGTLISNVITGGAILLWRGRWKDDWYSLPGRHSLEKQKPGWKFIVMFLATAMLVWLGTQSGFQWLSVFFPAQSESYLNAIEISPMGYILLTVVAAPVTEELLFRGVCFEQFRKVWGPVVACLASTGLFAIMHANLPQIYLAFVCGLFFCAFHELTGSIMYSIMAHVFYNLVTVLILQAPSMTFFGMLFSQALMWGVIVWLYLKVLERRRREVACLNVCMRG